MDALSADLQTGFDSQHIFDVKLDTAKRLDTLFNSGEPVVNNQPNKYYSPTTSSLKDVPSSMQLLEAWGSDNPDVAKMASEVIASKRTPYQNIGLGRTLDTPYSEAEKYIDKDYGFDAQRQSNEDYYYRNQYEQRGTLENIAKNIGTGIGRVVTGTVLKLGQSVGLLGSLIGNGLEEIVNSDNNNLMADVADNALSKWMKESETYLNNRFLPVYHSLDYDKKGFFSKLGDATYWTDEIADGVSFMTSTIIETWATGGLLGEIPAIAKFGAIPLKGAGSGILKFATGADDVAGIGAWALNTASESAFEASDTFKQVTTALKEQRDNGENDYTDDKIREIAGDKAAYTFGSNILALSLSNALENRMIFQPLLKKFKGANYEGRLNRGTFDLDEGLNAKERVYNYATKAGRKLNWKDPNSAINFGGKRLATSLAMEALWEENSQLAIQRVAQGQYTRQEADNGTSIIHPSGFWSQLWNQSTDAFTAFGGVGDKEVASSIGAGAIIGLLGTTAGNIASDERKENRNKIKLAIADYQVAKNNLFNFDDIYKKDDKGVILKDPKTNKPIIDEAKLKAKVDGIKDVTEKQAAIDTLKDPALRAFYQNELLADYVAASVEAGINSTVSKKLEALRSKTPEQLQALGFNSEDPNMQISDYLTKSREYEEIYKKYKDTIVKKPNNVDEKLFNSENKNRAHQTYKSAVKANYSLELKNKYYSEFLKENTKFPTPLPSNIVRYNELIAKLNALKQTEGVKDSNKAFYEEYFNEQKENIQKELNVIKEIVSPSLEENNLKFTNKGMIQPKSGGLFSQNLNKSAELDNVIEQAKFEEKKFSDNDEGYSNFQLWKKGSPKLEQEEEEEETPTIGKIISSRNDQKPDLSTLNSEFKEKGFSVYQTNDGLFHVKQKTGSNTSTVHDFNSLDEATNAIRTNTFPPPAEKQKAEVKNIPIFDENNVSPQAIDAFAKKEDSRIPFGTRRPAFEELTPEQEYLHLEEYLFNNLFFKKDAFGTPPTHLVAIPVTDVNIRAVEEKLSLPENSLQYIIDREPEQYKLSKNQKSGHITFIYVSKSPENTYQLIDVNGLPITNPEEFKDKIPQGRYIDGDEQALRNSKYPPFRATTTEKTIKEIMSIINTVREHYFALTTFEEIPFTISNGIPQYAETPSTGEFNRIPVGETNLIDEKDINNNSVIVAIGKHATELQDGQTLIVGRPYLTIKGQDPEGNPLTRYQYLDNDPLSPSQKEGVIKAIKSINQKILDTKEDDKNKTGILNRISTTQELHKTPEFNYLRGVVKNVVFSINKNGELQANIKNGATIVLSNLQNTEWLDSIYHNVDNSLLGQEFTDFSLEKPKKVNYTEYLLKGKNPPLTVRLKREESNPEPPYIQRYAILSFPFVSKIQETKKAPAKQTKTKEEKKENDEAASFLKKIGKNIEPEDEEVGDFDSEEDEEIALSNMGINVDNSTVTPTNTTTTTEEVDEALAFLSKTGKATPTKTSSPQTVQTPTSSSNIEADIERRRQEELTKLKKGIPAMITKKLEAELKQYGFTQQQIDKMTPIVANEVLINAKYDAELKKSSNIKQAEEIKAEEEDDDASILLNKIKRNRENKEAFKLSDESWNEELGAEEIEWLERVLPQIGFSQLDYERLLGDRVIWGSFKQGAITLWKGAKKGTIYHEAFEAVWNGILTQQQQENLYQDFLQRTGEFVTFENNVVKHSNATFQEAKERMADEMFDYKEGVLNIETAPKTFYQAVLDFVKRVFNWLTGKNQILPVTELYKNIDSGKYSNTPINITTDEYFQIGKLSEFESMEYIKSFSSMLFKELANNSADLLMALEEETSDVPIKFYSRMKELIDTFYSDDEENVQRLEELYNKMIKSLKARANITEEKAVEEADKFFKDSHKRWKEIRNSLPEFIKAHQNFISHFGVSFNTTITEQDINEFITGEKEGTKSSNEYAKDAFKSEVKDSVSATLKMLIATLSDVIFSNNIRTNGVNELIDNISDVTFMPTTILNYKAMFNRMLNNLTNQIKPEAIKRILETISTPTQEEKRWTNSPAMQIKAHFRQIYEMLYEKTPTTEAELKLRAKTIGSFLKQKPTFMRMRLDVESELSFFANELFEGHVKNIENRIFNNLRFNRTKYGIEWLTSVPNPNKSQAHINKFVFKIKPLKLPEQIKATNVSSQSTVDNLVLGLQKLGIDYFTSQTLKELTKEEQNTILSSYNTAISYLSTNVSPFVDINSKGLDSNSGFKPIIQIIAERSVDETDPQHFSPEGEKVQNVGDVNFPSTIISTINSYRLLYGEDAKAKFLQDYPYYDDFYSRRSRLLDKIFNGEIENLSVLSGIAVDGNDEKSKNTSATTEEELILLRFNAGLNSNKRKAIFPILENADGSTDWAMQVGKYVDDRILDDNLQIIKDYLVDEIILAADFSNRNTNEIINSSIETKAGSRFRGKTVQFFLDILPESKLRQIHEFVDKYVMNADREAVVDDVEAYFEDVNPRFFDEVGNHYAAYIENIINKQLDYFIAKDMIVERNGGWKFIFLDSDFKTKDIHTLDEIKAILREREFNYSFHNIEMFKTFFGAPYYYKDGMKRFKSFQSPRVDSINSEEFNNALTDIMNTLQFDDQNVKIPVTNSSYRTFGENLRVYSVSDIKTINEEVYKTQASNQVDAQSYFTLPVFREILWKSGGKFTTAQEKTFIINEAYERTKLSKKENPQTNKPYYTYNSSELEAFDKAILAKYKIGEEYSLPTFGTISVLKPIISGIKSGNIFEPILIKTSSAPITWQLLEGTKMEHVYLDMYVNNVQGFTYPSAVKVGQPNTSSIIASDGTILSPSSVTTPIEIPFSLVGIQQETQALKNESPTGTQPMKLISTDLFDSGIPQDYNSNETDVVKQYEEFSLLSEEEKLASSELYRLEQEHKNALTNVFENNYQNMLSDLGMEEEYTDGVLTGYKYDNLGTFWDRVRKYVELHGVSQNIMDYLPKKENGELAIPLQNNPDYSSIKSIIYSMIDKGIISPRMNGGQKILFSSALLDKLGHEYNVTTTGKNNTPTLTNTSLKFYTNKETGTTRMEVMLSHRMLSDVNRNRKIPLTKEQLIEYLNNNQSILLEGIGYRIPTQALASIDAFIIKGFLPEYMGDTIAVPSDITTKAGSDFDVDKLTTYLNNYVLNSEGLPEYVIPFSSIELAKIHFNGEYSNIIEEELLRIEKYDEFRKNLVSTFKTIEKLVGENNLNIDSLRNQLGENLFEFYQYHANNIISDVLEEAANEGINPSDYIQNQIEKLKTKEEFLEKRRNKYVDKRVKMSIQNEYIRAMAQIVLHPYNFKRLVSPTTSAEFESGAEKELPDGTKNPQYTIQINKLKNPNWKDATGEYNPAHYLDFLYMTKSRNSYLQSKTGVGVYAVSTTSHANFQKFMSLIIPNVKENDVIFDEPLTLNQPTDFLKLKHNQKTINGNKYASFSGIGSKYNVAEYLSKMISGAVDNVKDNWIEAYGATGIVRGIAAIGFKLEIDPYELGLLINHPIVKEYVRLNSARRSPSYLVDEILREENQAFNDQDIYTNFKAKLGIENYNSRIPEFGNLEISYLERHIISAGENSNFKKFLEKVNNVQEREIALAVLRNFLQLKTYAEDLRVVVDSSNHETIHLNSNYASKTKEANYAFSKGNSIKAYIAKEGKMQIVPAAEALRTLTFTGRIIENLQSFEKNLVYPEILTAQAEAIADNVISTMQGISDDTDQPIRWLNQEKVVKLGEKMEELTFNSMIHSGNVPFTYSSLKTKITDNVLDIFDINGDIYKAISEKIEILKTQPSIDKIKDGSHLFDFLTLQQISETSPYWYIKITGKPSSDEFAQNQFYEAVKNLKIQHPDLYEILSTATLIQSGTFFDRNSFTGYILPEDYAEFSKSILSVQVTEDFFDKLKDNYAANFFQKRDNGVTTKIDKIYPPRIIQFYRENNIVKAPDLKIPLSATIENNNVTTKNFANQYKRQWVPATNEQGVLSNIYIFPVMRYGSFPPLFKKQPMFNKYVQRQYLNWTTKGEDNKKTNFLIKNMGLLINVNDVEYTVFQHIPIRGTDRHLELQQPTDDNTSRNSQFPDNVPVDYLSQEEIINLLQDKFSNFPTPHIITKAKPTPVKIEAIVSKQQNNSLPSKDMNIKGIKISSYQKGLGNDLTNVHYATNGKSKFDITPSDKSLTLTSEAKKKWGMSVEAWYQSNSTKALGVAQDDNYDYKLITNLIKDKLTQYPELVSKINEAGGLPFLQNSTHSIGYGRWSSKGDNLFIKALSEAFSVVNNKINPLDANGKNHLLFLNVHKRNNI